MVRERSLEALGLAEDPIAHPLSYPGALPGSHGLLADGCYLPLTPSQGKDVGSWLAETGEGPAELDVLLEKHGRPSAGSRFPVLSVGSNAAPAQLRRKFERQGVEPIVPIVRAQVSGIAQGVSAHVSSAGYIPATGLLAPDQVADLFVAWLDADELHAVDCTEPNYYRVLLPGDRFPVVLPFGERLGACCAYISKWGCLTGRDGEPWALVSQHELLTTLLAQSRALRETFADTPEGFVRQAAADSAKRERARRIFQDEGWVRPQPELEQLRHASPAGQTYAESGAESR
jgi:hypothetical protein